MSDDQYNSCDNAGSLEKSDSGSNFQEALENQDDPALSSDSILFIDKEDPQQTS